MKTTPCTVDLRRYPLAMPTIQRMAKYGLERSSAGNAEYVQKTLEATGIDFIPENGGGPGLRLRK